MALSHSAKLGLQTALSCGRYVCRTLLTTTPGQGGGGAAAASQARRRHHQLLSALSGFPKDLRYGPSVVLRKDGFGDDACFIARHRTADVVGVADGVGGWRTYGVDPSRFSRSLMKICAQLVTSGQFEPASPADLIAASYKHMHDDQMKRVAELASATAPSSGGRFGGRLKRGSNGSKPLVGSSTACVVVLDRANSCIHTANIGDSGFLVIRDGKVVHRSREQQHYFNAPFQLSLPLNAESSGFLSDSPDSAETTSFVVREGDLIVVATDGLFDNMPTHLIENELNFFQKDLNNDDANEEATNITNDSSGISSSSKISQSSSSSSSNSNNNNSSESLRVKAHRLQQACNSLAFQARQLAMDCNHMSPFARKAQEHGIEDAVGGKPDDITLILALVTGQSLERVDEEPEYEASLA